MKKSELTQLTQLVELLVEREVKKQLPKLIGEVFQSMAGRAMVTEHVSGPSERKDYIAKEIEAATIKKDPHEFRASLKELFTGATPVTRTELETGTAPRQIRQLAKDPVLNEILNNTVGLRAYEKAKGMGVYAAMDQPAMMAPPAMQATGVGEMMTEAEMPTFARGEAPMVPVSAPSTSDGHAVMAALPEGLSALDVAKAVTPPAVANAMTDFSRMRKVLEMSKGKRY
jgi:hypothetical protein